MHTTGSAEIPTGAERKRVEAVVETLATLHSQGESLAEVAHDARNMVTALGLYCDLLEEPGVLAAPYAHYGSELRLVAAASRRLVEKLVVLDDSTAQPALWRADAPAEPWPAPPAADQQPGAHRLQKESWDFMMPAGLVTNLAAELLATRNLLSALAGPSVAVTVDIEGGARPVRMTGEDLTRVLVNLVKNAVEALPGGGLIQVSLREHLRVAGGGPWLALNIEDNGPGIPLDKLERIFESGYSAHAPRPEAVPRAIAHRGLGLTISKSIVETAGGRIRAENRPNGGARIVIELPEGK